MKLLLRFIVFGLVLTIPALPACLLLLLLLLLLPYLYKTNKAESKALKKGLEVANKKVSQQAEIIGRLEETTQVNKVVTRTSRLNDRTASTLLASWPDKDKRQKAYDLCGGSSSNAAVFPVSPAHSSTTLPATCSEPWVLAWYCGVKFSWCHRLHS